MLIKCPSCLYQRDVPESALRPGKTYKVTCPKCSEIFPFSAPEALHDTPVSVDSPVGIPPNEATAKQESATEERLSPTHAAEPEASPADKKASLATASEPSAEKKPEQEEDDPLPKGAVIPELPRMEENRAFSERPTDTEEHQEKPQGLLGHWLQIRENLRRYDESQELEEEIPTDGRPDGAPWENPQYYGMIGSFSRTVLGAMFHPREFFRHLRCANPVLYPILFFVLLSLYQVLFSWLWSIKEINQFLLSATDPQKIAMAEMLMEKMSLPLIALFTPFFSIFQAVILAGLYHLMIRMVSPDKADFALTLRVICYSSAPFILCIVPTFGSYIASVWFVISTFIGCRFALNMSFIRTLGALLPLYILEMAFVMHMISSQ